MYNNYKVIKTQNLADINSLGTLLVHEKSQAKVLLIEKGRDIYHRSCPIKNKLI